FLRIRAPGPSPEEPRAGLLGRPYPLFPAPPRAQLRSRVLGRCRASRNSSSSDALQAKSFLAVFRTSSTIEQQSNEPEEECLRGVLEEEASSRRLRSGGNRGRVEMFPKPCPIRGRDWSQPQVGH